jgi:hypothetical protein
MVNVFYEMQLSRKKYMKMHRFLFALLYKTFHVCKIKIDNIDPWAEISQALL